MKELLKKLTAEFADRDYAHAYMESHLISRLAAQIHVIRKQRGWSQEKLASESGIAQERTSKIESADFDSLTIKTLQKFSRAFDAHLHISFVPFSKGILDTTNLTTARLEVTPRVQDLAASQKRTFKIDASTGAWIAEANGSGQINASTGSGTALVDTQRSPPVAPLFPDDMPFSWTSINHESVDSTING